MRKLLPLLPAQQVLLDAVMLALTVMMAAHLFAHNDSDGEKNILILEILIHLRSIEGVLSYPSLPHFSSQRLNTRYITETCS